MEHPLCTGDTAEKKKKEKKKANMCQVTLSWTGVRIGLIWTRRPSKAVQLAYFEKSEKKKGCKTDLPPNKRAKGRRKKSDESCLMSCHIKVSVRGCTMRFLAAAPRLARWGVHRICEAEMDKPRGVCVKVVVFFHSRLSVQKLLIGRTVYSVYGGLLSNQKRVASWDGRMGELKKQQHYCMKFLFFPR